MIIMYNRMLSCRLSNAPSAPHTASLAVNELFGRGTCPYRHLTRSKKLAESAAGNHNSIENC